MNTKELQNFPPLYQGSLKLALAQTPSEKEAFFRLRYEVFCQEWGANIGCAETKTEQDLWDTVAHHLLVTDVKEGRVVAGYRLVTQEGLEQNEGLRWSAEKEFDLSAVMAEKTPHQHWVEVSRACVHPTHRAQGALGLLWLGLFQYIRHFQVDLLLGVVSFQGVDVQGHEEALSYLYYFHQAPKALETRARHPYGLVLPRINKEDLDPVKIFRKLPPLIKGYIHLGGFFGKEAYLDHVFQSTDLLLLLYTKNIALRYRNHYEKALQDLA